MEAFLEQIKGAMREAMCSEQPQPKSEGPDNPFDQQENWVKRNECLYTKFGNF